MKKNFISYKCDIGIRQKESNELCIRTIPPDTASRIAESGRRPMVVT